MNERLTYIILAGAVLLFIGQFYFRYKVMRGIRALSKKNIGLGMSQIFNKRRLHKDVIAFHKADEREIVRTAGYIRNALLFTVGMILLMVVAFLLLMGYSD